MAQASVGTPAATVRSAATGVFFMAVFGTLWVCIGMVGLNGWGAPWLYILLPLIGLALLVGGIRLMRMANRFTTPPTPENALRWKKRRRWFGIIFASEGIAMGVVSAICGATHHFDLLFPLIALIVGLHFFPLAPLFERKAHYVTGALLCLLSLLVIWLLPAHAIMGGQQIMIRNVVVGFGSALILWVTGLLMLLQGFTYRVD